jgi:hypothetical protein
MNGISSNLKEELKKSTNNKTRDRIRFLSAIVITNIFVAMICLPSSNGQTKSVKPVFKLHPNHQLLILPLTLLLPLDQSLESVPVTLISKDKKVLVKKAWLHNEILKENHFKIEILESEVVHVSATTEEDMIAVPYVETKLRKVTARGSKYEVNL